MPVLPAFSSILNEVASDFGDCISYDQDQWRLTEFRPAKLVVEREISAGGDVAGRRLDWTDLTPGAVVHRNLSIRLDDDDSASRPSSDRGVMTFDVVPFGASSDANGSRGHTGDPAIPSHPLSLSHLVATYVRTTPKHYPLRAYHVKIHNPRNGRGIPLDIGAAFVQTLIHRVLAQNLPVDFTIGSGLSSAPTLNHIHRRGRIYVGALSVDAQVAFRGRSIPVHALAGSIKATYRRRIHLDGIKHPYFVMTLRAHEIDHPIRMIIIWHHTSHARIFKTLITNQPHWSVDQIIRTFSLLVPANGWIMPLDGRGRPQLHPAPIYSTSAV